MMTWGLGALRVVSEEVSRLPGLRLRCAHRSAMLRRCRSRVSLWVGVCSSRPHTAWVVVTTGDNRSSELRGGGPGELVCRGLLFLAFNCVDEGDGVVEACIP
eukprot:1159603-Pelagomonas_calceolata.AAC.1